MSEAIHTAPQAPSRRIDFAGRVLALILGLVLALALVEIGGRLALGFEPLPGWAQDFNSRVGFELRPYDEYTYASKSGEFNILVHHNSRGLHDVEHTLSKPAGTFRILVLSDSYGQAREVPLEVSFTRQLDGLLNDSAPQAMTFEVINAGHFGLGTTQEYLYYTVEGWRYDPDLVLLGFYVGNDVVDNHAPLVKAWNNTDTVDFPYFTPDGTLHQPGLATGRRALSWLRQNIYLVNVASNVLAGTGDVDRVEVGDPNTVAERALRVPAGVYLPPDVTWRAAWAVTDHALAELKTAVEQDGGQFAVFLIPDRRQVYDADWQALLDRLPDLDPAALDCERPTQTALDLLAAQNIPALDLLEPFRAADERLYFEIDGHFNAAGHTLTAELLAGWLRESGLIAGAAEP
ncbi:MAG: hypothetical protein JXJ20_10440 [Anaerolineae bacterium]|nr:hypothetical protein [Anaerolineae bacterium]